MSTRAMLSFTCEDFGTFNVYRHGDGYPTEVVKAIERAIDNAWQLPRFESNEFAAAFIAANKAREALAVQNPDMEPEAIDILCRGGLRLMPSGDWKVAALNCADIEYRYEITCPGEGLCVKLSAVSYEDEWTETVLFDGTFVAFKARASEWD